MNFPLLVESDTSFDQDSTIFRHTPYAIYHLLDSRELLVGGYVELLEGSEVDCASGRYESRVGLSRSVEQACFAPFRRGREEGKDRVELRSDGFELGGEGVYLILERFGVDG